jgi:hypothetical protein
VEYVLTPSRIVEVVLERSSRGKHAGRRLKFECLTGSLACISLEFLWRAVPPGPVAQWLEQGTHNSGRQRENPLFYKSTRESAVVVNPYLSVQDAARGCRDNWLANGLEQGTFCPMLFFTWVQKVTGS